MTIDECRICRVTKKLSDDHVPPRGWTGGAPVLQRDFLNLLNGPQVVRGKTKQNGTKFHTICGDCNSLLGGKYDPELIKLANFTKLFLLRDLPNKYQISVSLKSTRIIRSVLGHLLAANYEDYYTRFDDLVHEYLMHNKSKITDALDINVWIYPYQTTVILRDVAIGWIKQDKVTIKQILKFYPLAFVVTERDALPKEIALHKLEEGGIDECFSFSAPNFIENDGWPEYPSDNRFLLAGRSLHSSVFAVPKPKKK